MRHLTCSLESEGLDRRSSTTEFKRKRRQKVLRRIPLWYFLHEMLCMDTDSQLVCWTDKKNLIFQIRHPEELASLWGSVKGKSEMTYSKLARGLRYYYGKGVIEKVTGSRFTYQFIRSRKTEKVFGKLDMKSSLHCSSDEELELSDTESEEYFSSSSLSPDFCGISKYSSTNSSVEVEEFAFLYDKGQQYYHGEVTNASLLYANEVKNQKFTCRNNQQGHQYFSTDNMAMISSVCSSQEFLTNKDNKTLLEEFFKMVDLSFESSHSS